MRLPRSFQTSYRALYSRITLNRTTTAFFIFSFFHCFAQGIIQSFLFSIDAEYNSLLSSITTIAHIPSKNMTYLEGSSGKWHLRMCNDIPYGSMRPCMDIFVSAIDSHNPLISAERQLTAQGNYLVIQPIGDTSAANVTGITLSSGLTTVVLDPQCIQTLLYSEQIVQHSKREDVIFVLLQFWLFAISLYAIIRDSVPHTLAVLITRGIITGWSAYAIWRTGEIKDQFTDIIFQSGTPCSFNVFPMYFDLRISYQIPDLILNVTALLIACYLSSTLLRDYNAQSFKCVGAPKHITIINKFFMALLACLQLECFVLVTAGGLWIDVLVNTAISSISSISIHNVLYKGLFTATTILLLPWIAMGVFAIRHERKKLMVAFLGIASFFLSGWLIMFYSQVYRWTFMQWPYLAAFTVASLILIVANIVLGVICRLNFGKGLAQYLHAEAMLASSDFAPEVFKHDEEKGTMDLDIKATFEATDEAFYSTPFFPKRDSFIQNPQPAHVHVHVSAAGPQTSAYRVPYNLPF